MTMLGSGGGLQGLLDWALAQRGKPYVWGGTGPDGYDCSGLTEGAFSAVGINLPRTSQEQRNAGVGVSLNDIQPGDLVTFTYPDSGGNPGPGNHVALYYGQGQVIEAARSGTPVKIAPMDVAHVDRVRRVLGSSGSGGGGAGGATAADAAGGSTVRTAGLQQAGYDAVIDLTPWGIPLNPFKLPGWVEGKLGGALGNPLGGQSKGGLWDVVGPITLAVMGVAVGAGLLLLGAYVSVKPAVDGGLDTLGKVNSIK